jgi:hypothetical protein
MVLRAYLIFDHIVYDAIRQTPLDEVELGHGRAEALELYALCPAKRIKELLGVAVQTRLVGNMDRKGSS